jgi:mannose-6-phosphate isomerase-like protein (cupin superfamily)
MQEISGAEGVSMIVVNVDSPEAKQTTYVAHRGGVARMLLTSHFMKSMEFFAWAVVPAGNTMEEHTDEVEEVYFILSGEGLMKVGDEEKQVKTWDAIWLPAGVPHAFTNTGTENAFIAVVAAYPR